MKKILTAMVAFSFVIASASAVDAAIETIGDPGRIWAVPNDDERGMHVQRFLDASPGIPSSYLIDWNLWQANPYNDPTCSSAEDPKCTAGSLGFNALLPVCGTISSVYCIEDFGVVSSSGESSTASFSRYFPNEGLNKFAGSEKLKLPFGATGSIFDLPSAPHEGGTLYYVSALTKGELRKESGAVLDALNIEIYPVKLEPDDSLIQGNDPGMSMSKGLGDGTPAGLWRFASFGFSGKSFCVAGSVKENLCAQRYAFPAEKKFYIKLKLQSKPKGWLHGRIAKPDVSFTETSSGYSFYIAASPVAVPVVYKMYRYPAMPEALKDQYDVVTGAYIKDPNFLNNPTNFVQGGRSAEDPDPLKRNNIYGPTPSSPAGMEQLKLWIPFVKDKATALLSYWSVRTLTQGEMEGSSQCFRDTNRVSGIVTTNATQYSAGPPTLDKVEGTLNYVVAAPHYDPRDKDFKGSYDLVMRSDVARCIYGFTKAPINATISITSGDGTPQVATTLIGERNGWLYLQAKNFEFSAPIIKAKLTQEVVVEPTPTPTPTPAATKKPVVAKKITITCVKGKTVKKVTAAKPTCPSGFKKKA